jgi:hypothetical protein
VTPLLPIPLRIGVGGNRITDGLHLDPFWTRRDAAAEATHLLCPLLPSEATRQERSKCSINRSRGRLSAARGGEGDRGCHPVKTEDAIGPYLLAFEAGSFPTLSAGAHPGARCQAAELRSRRAEGADLASEVAERSEPYPAALDGLLEWLAEAIEAG